ncbi:MAG TPA: DUF4097 family beta strand repeat-containing protein [Terriglobales bacterium]|nr:DUF4097 family beta strand repeat-containing protein [Terriglobales bacterium]
MSDAYYPRRRSLSGPFILIVLGMLFLLGNLHVIGWHSLGALFARYWPVLLIVAGAIKLLEYYTSRRDESAAGMSAGGILLVILLVCFGLAATAAYKVNWPAVSDETGVDPGDFMGGVFGNAYSFTHTVQQSIPRGASLRVVSDRGDVTVNTWDGDEIKIDVQKKVHAKDQNEAQKMDESTQPLITLEGNNVTVNANTAGAGRGGVESDLQIYLPKKAGVEVSTKHGDITVRDRIGDIKTSSLHGDMTVESVTGNVNLDSHRGSLHVKDIIGDVSVAGRVDDSTISNVSGNLNLSGDFFGEMNLSKIGKGVTFRSSRTDMEFGKLDGELTMESGDLRAKSLFGPLRLATRSKDIHLDEVNGDIRLENSNGTVEVHINKPLGRVEISNSKGDVRLELPAQASFQLEASTRSGDINNDFGLKVDSSNGSSRASGSVGSGGPTLQITNQYGNVEIRKAG